MPLREIIFDGPPTFATHMIEVPNGEGTVKIGEWIDRGDGTWSLRLDVPDDLVGSFFTSDYYSYQSSIEVSIHSDWPFYALIMAAMRKADTFNGARLRAAFPDVAEDLEARHAAPGGLRASDSDSVKRRVLGSSWQDPDLLRRLR